jgi:nucleoside-diphosphate-sugar epimerase
VARLIAIGLEILYKPMRKMPPLHRRRLEFFLRNQSFDITFAKACCEFSPETRLEEGMRLTIDWYKKHGWI